MKPVGNSSVNRLTYSQAIAARFSWGGLHLPNYVCLVMIMIAAAAISISTAVRSREEARNAQHSLQQTSERVAQMRADNERIRARIKQLRDDPRAAEQAAREQLNYLRANEVAVKLK